MNSTTMTQQADAADYDAADYDNDTGFLAWFWRWRDWIMVAIAAFIIADILT